MPLLLVLADPSTKALGAPVAPSTVHTHTSTGAVHAFPLFFAVGTLRFRFPLVAAVLAYVTAAVMDTKMLWRACTTTSTLLGVLAC